MLQQWLFRKTLYGIRLSMKLTQTESVKSPHQRISKLNFYPKTLI